MGEKYLIRVSFRILYNQTYKYLKKICNSVIYCYTGRSCHSINLSIDVLLHDWSLTSVLSFLVLFSLLSLVLSLFDVMIFRPI